MITIKIVKRLKLSIRNSDLEARKGSCYLYILVHAFSKYNCAFNCSNNVLKKSGLLNYIHKLELIVHIDEVTNYLSFSY